MHSFLFDLGGKIMEKTLIIDGKQVRFKSTAATTLRYKAQFGKDFLAEIMKMGAVEKLGQLKADDISTDDVAGLDFDVFYNIAWVFAKTANPSIADPITWLDEFESFPMIEIIPELQDMIASSITTKKK